MRSLIVFIVVALAYAQANCGCLKNPAEQYYSTRSSSQYQHCKKACSENLKVVSPPSCPIKVIYRYPPHIPELCREHQYQVQLPAPALPSLPAPTKNYNYKLEPVCLNRERYVEDCYAKRKHEYQVQLPLPSLPAPPAPPLDNLKYRADRIVLEAPAPLNHGCWAPPAVRESLPLRRLPGPVVGPNWQGAIAEFLPLSHCHRRPPTCITNFEEICDRYGGRVRRKRQVDFVKHGANFVVNMLPDFVRDPLKQTFRSIGHMDGYDLDNPQKSLKEKHNENLKKMRQRLQQRRVLNSLRKNKGEGTYSVLSSDSANVPTDFLYKLAKIKHQNHAIEEKNDHALSSHFGNEDQFLENIFKHRRSKRDIIIGGRKVDHPFYRIKPNREEELYSSEERNIEPDLIIGKSIIKKAVQEEMNRYHQNQIVSSQKNNIVPQNPLFLLFKAPVLFLKHFHELNKGINPLFGSLPKLVYGTKKYFRDFGRNFKNNCLNLCSDIIGDFTHNSGDGSNVFSQMLHPRFRRNAKKSNEVCEKICEEENFQKMPQSNSRKKREENLVQVPVEIEAIYIIPQKDAFKKVKKVKQLKKKNQFEPLYSLAFNNLNENENKSRKKRYIVQVCNEDDVHDYFSEKLSNEDYFEPLNNYYNNLNNFLNKLMGFGQNTKSSQPNFYEEPKLKYKKRRYYKEDASSEETYEKRKKKIKVEKLKPRVIIDNHGIPFLELDGMKRPFIPKRRKDFLRSRNNYDSSDETQDRIVGLIQHAREKEMVGSPQVAYVPAQNIRERISSMLAEIDELVHIDLEQYDHIFDDLIKIQHIKNSIVQDWKRLLIKERIDDVNAKIGMLDKFRDLQHFKNVVVEEIARALKQNDSKFVRKKFINCLIRLHKLQCIISNVMDDFEEHLTMHTHFNAKKEIEYVDLLSNLNFANSKTRNDIIKSFCKERDTAMQDNLELLNKLKKMIVDCEETCELVQKEARVLWEMKNIEKLQKQTIKDMNRKLELKYKIKKELKILIDLQKRYDRCLSEQKDLINEIEKENSEENGVKLKKNSKKDTKQLIEDIKRKYELFMKKSRKNLVKKSKNK